MADTVAVRDKEPAWLIYVLAVAGMVLRAVQFFANRSMYVDEAAVALNLRTRSFAELLSRPLDFAQTAPVGFLLQQKLLVQTLGEHEYVLRLAPFLASLAAIPLFLLLARRFLHGIALVCVFAVFVFSLPLIYFAADSKPYAVDLLVTLIVMLAALRYRERPDVPGAAAFVAASAIAVWFSQPVVFVVAGVSVAIFRSLYRAKNAQALRRLAAGFPVLLVSTAASVMAAQHTLTTAQRAYMEGFWRSGFMPLIPTSLADLLWLPATLVRVSADPIGVMLIPGVLALMLVLGVVALKRMPNSGFIILPVLLALVASALRAYPFGGLAGPFAGRVVLFLTPCFLIIAGAGIGSVLRLVRPAVAIAITVSIVLGVVAPLLRWFPTRRDELRPIIQYIAAHRQHSDQIYVSYAARHVYQWYERRLGLHNAPTIYGLCARNRPVVQLADLKRIHSGRVWIIMGHAQPVEVKLAVAYFDLNGRRIDNVKAAGAFAVLYDMHNTTRPLLPREPELYRVTPFAREFGCGGLNEWPTAYAREDGPRL